MIIIIFILIFNNNNVNRLRPLSYPDSHVILMCFSIDSPDSLTNVFEKWYSELRYYCPKTPIILVATKKDLRYNSKVIADLKRFGQEPVKTLDGQMVAKKIDAYAYFECSSKTREGVAQIFETAARASLLDSNGNKLKRKKICKFL